MHAEANGAGPVITMRDQKWWGADLRKQLEAAHVNRAALFRNDSTCKRLRFHDLRGRGLTWMAIRGDDALKIQHRKLDFWRAGSRGAVVIRARVRLVEPPTATVQIQVGDVRKRIMGARSAETCRRCPRTPRQKK
ncbi:MAG: hypothetical protein SFV15_19020 [Polyangiaceae bacterium]|nr:hypothetical protein [Polyangiaceae bacterium]